MSVGQLEPESKVAGERWSGEVVGPITPGVDWIDLLDPDEAMIRKAWAGSLHPQAMEHLVRPNILDSSQNRRDT